MLVRYLARARAIDIIYVTLTLSMARFCNVSLPFRRAPAHAATSIECRFQMGKDINGNTIYKCK